MSTTDDTTNGPPLIEGYSFLKDATGKPGVYVGIQKMIVTTGLYLLEKDFWITRFCYETTAEALAAFMEWDGNGDPPGNWIVQKPEQRYNPNHKDKS